VAVVGSLNLQVLSCRRLLLQAQSLYLLRSFIVVA
jgi:hypothetical protein